MPRQTSARPTTHTACPTIPIAQNVGDTGGRIIQRVAVGRQPIGRGKQFADFISETADLGRNFWASLARFRKVFQISFQRYLARTSGNQTSWDSSDGSTTAPVAAQTLLAGFSRTAAESNVEIIVPPQPSEHCGPVRWHSRFKAR